MILPDNALSSPSALVFSALTAALIEPSPSPSITSNLPSNALSAASALVDSALIFPSTSVLALPTAV